MYIYMYINYMHIFIFICTDVIFFFYKLTERIIPCTLHLSYCAMYRRSWKFL